MAKVFGSLDGFETGFSEDGHALIRAHELGRAPFEILISFEQVVELQEYFQSVILQKLAARGEGVGAALVSIVGCQSTMDGGGAVLVSTREIGTVALQGEPDILRAMIRTIERILELKEAVRH